MGASNNNNASLSTGASWSVADFLLSGTHEETFYEEIANSVTHFMGIVLSVCGMYYLLLLISQHRKSWEHVVGCAVYGASLLVLYICSTLYHSVGVIAANLKPNFQCLDHAAIYVLIAGTYTPLTLINLMKHGQRTIVGITVLSVIWMCALVGITVKVFLGVNSVPEGVGVAMYLMMGWLAVLFGKPFMKVIPWSGMKWIAAGGFSYSIGTILLLWDALHFNHAVWHLFVMIGSACHFIAVVLSTLPVSHQVHKLQMSTHHMLSHIFSVANAAKVE